MLPAFYTPRIDVAEDARSLPIHLDVPGVRQADLEITVEKNAVAVRGAVGSRSANSAVSITSVPSGSRTISTASQSR